MDAPRRNLKKNQACLQCRRGKMKCDAAQPCCTNCVKAWQLLLETPGVPGSSAPTCDYDPVEGLIFTPETISDPAARIRAIQDQLAQLHGKLQEARDEAGYRKPLHQHQRTPSSSSNLKRRPTPSSHSSSQSSHSKRRRTAQMSITEEQQLHEQGGGYTILPPITTDPSSSSSSPSEGGEVFTASPTSVGGDLPSFETMEYLIDTFLSSDPHAARIFHPTHLRTHTPSKALLHAICASALRYVPPTYVLPPDFAGYHAARARRLINAALTEHQDTLYHEQDGRDGQGQGGQGQMSPEDLAARKRRIRMKRDSKLFVDMVQPLIVLAGYYYSEGCGMEVWADVGALVRAIMSLGLNHPPTNQHSPTSTPAQHSDFLIAQEEKKRAFWSTFMLDRLLSAGGWAHCMAAEDSVGNFAILNGNGNGQGNGGNGNGHGNAALLMSSGEFRELGVQRSPNPGRPAPPPPASPLSKSNADSYSLLIDATAFLGRITDFRSRARLAHRSPLAQSILKPTTLSPSTTTLPSNPASSFLLSFQNASLSFILAQDPILRWEFQHLAAELSGGVGYWSSYGVSGRGRREGSMPLLFKYSIGLADTGGEGGGGEKGGRRRSMVDMDLFLAHMVHYAATILLHFPVSSFSVPPSSTSSSSSSSNNTPPRMTTIPPPRAPHPPRAQHPPVPTPLQIPIPPPRSQPATSIPPRSQQVFVPAPPPTLTADLISASSCMSDSRKECVDAARKIVDALALLRCTTFDIAHVHPFGATCWYLAGVVLLYEHRRWVDEGDIIQQTAIAKDVQILRLSLLKYGQRAGIGLRLEEQLTAIQERIAAPHNGGTPTSDTDGSENQNQEEYRHDVIPVFPFDRATYDSMPKTYPPSRGGAPLPQALAS